MSSTLHWRPVVPVNSGALPFAVKKAISPKYWGHDGSLAGEPRILMCDDILYLEGLRDAGIAEVQQLIDIIMAHGVVELFWLT